MFKRFKMKAEMNWLSFCSCVCTSAHKGRVFIGVSPVSDSVNKAGFAQVYSVFELVSISKVV